MRASKTHYLSIIGFIVFALAALFLFALSFILALTVVFTYVTQSSTDLQSSIYSATLFFTGGLLGVVAVFSLLRFMDKPSAYVQVSTSFEVWKIVVGVVGTGIVLLLGSWLLDFSSINWLVMPLLTIPAVMLPIWTLTGLSAKGLSLGTRWRTWGAFGISMTLTPIVLFTLEVLVAVVIFFIVVIYAVANPDVAAEFEWLSTQFAYLDMQSEEALRLLAPYLVKAGVIIPALLFFSVIIPLMEELLKPLAVWLLVGKLESAAQGFAFGALSGAGFAIWETFNVSGQTADWDAVLFTRIGTGLLHITTSALMGGAIFMAVREQRYLRLLGTYLLVVLLHGLWNAAAVTSSFSSLAVTQLQMENLETLLWISAAGLIVIAVILLTLLIGTNRSLQKTMPVNATVQEEVPVEQNNTEL